MVHCFNLWNYELLRLNIVISAATGSAYMYHNLKVAHSHCSFLQLGITVQDINLSSLSLFSVQQRSTNLMLYHRRVNSRIVPFVSPPFSFLPSFFLSDFSHLVIARQHHGYRFLHSISVHGASFQPNSSDILIALTREN